MLPERQAQVSATLRQINQAWLTGNPDGIHDFIADEVVMMFPGFAGSVKGREAFVASFRDFGENARIESHSESDQQIDVVGNTAIVSFQFEMIYERGGSRYRSTGRDLWVFEDRANRWLAVWRTMLDLAEEPLQ
jgi:uncharacterized protein (TIGR02246 family)